MKHRLASVIPWTWGGIRRSASGPVDFCPKRSNDLRPNKLKFICFYIFIAQKPTFDIQHDQVIIFNRGDRDMLKKKFKSTN